MKTVIAISMALFLSVACAGASHQPGEVTASEPQVNNESRIKELPEPTIGNAQASDKKKESKKDTPEAPAPGGTVDNPYEIYKDIRELPDDVVTRRVREFVDIINSHNPERFHAYAKGALTDAFYNKMPAEMRVAITSSFYHETKGVKIYSKREFEGNTPPGENTYILTSITTGQWIALIIYVDSEAPHRISKLEWAPARPPHDIPQLKNLSQKQIIAHLKRYLAKLAKADIFSGTVLIAKDCKILFKKAYGKASKRFNVPNKIDTKFNIGSMNKMFTGVAIAQLVESDKLSFEDPLSKFVSEEWLPKSITEKIRIKHLLTHTSGLGCYFNETFENSSRLLFRNIDDYKTLVKTDAIAFEPGTKFKYSNIGMFMLGVVIEKITGQTYFDYVRENIYKPAGMKNTDCYEMDRPVPNLAIGYTRSDDGWRNNIFDHVLKGAAAGGGYSTAPDLLAFDIALRNNKLLSAEMTDRVLSAKPELNAPIYGYGFFITDQPGDRRVGHGGGFTGIRALLRMYLDSGYTAVFLSNYDIGTDAVADKMAQLIAARKK
ncbi:MAG: serine hydrolase domain-containing protein [Myxococcota bacterium]|nr:serine hydrolase domain-containing protein [Myxococcota bacterium]